MSSVFLVSISINYYYQNNYVPARIQWVDVNRSPSVYAASGGKMSRGETPSAVNCFVYYSSFGQFL